MYLTTFRFLRGWRVRKLFFFPSRHTPCLGGFEPTEVLVTASGVAEKKTPFRDGHHRMNDRIARLCIQENVGRLAMKMLLMGIAFAIGMVFASQAFALPYCSHGSWQHGHYVCADYDQ